MRMSKLVGKTIRETPKDAHTVSHAFLIRGGYVRPVSAGIYSLLPLGKRVCQKIEKIIREEMNRVDGQEVLMPVVLPRELWEESGRYQSVGPELLRFKDRNGKDMLLGMTHEEAVVHLARGEISSYKQLPVMLYQIQTKYRDEARPRAGLIRVREFTMKDAYSFHASESCLQDYYARAHAAYVRIFERLGMKNVVSIESDTGMMGGAASHEFMAIADCGEDTVFSCSSCEYRANKEIARTALKYERAPAKSLEKVHTPGKKTIEEVAQFLGVKPSQTGKAVFYSDDDGKLYFVVIRGDLEVNETKLRNLLKLRELKFANDEQIRGIGSVPGFASPLGISAKDIKIVFDRSAAESSGLVVGANELDYHTLGFDFDRDMKGVQVTVADIASAREGDPCPSCGHALKVDRGIEVGNIFQLGTKYSKSMNCTYLDQNGKAQLAIMGCYGIGVGRSMAAVIEQCHDKFGPIWPEEIAPYQVHLCALELSDETVKKTAEEIYDHLTGRGIEVLFDDRNEKAGSAFSDADLIGIPRRVIVSPKTLATGQVELKTRDGGKNFEKVTVAEALERLSSVKAL
jgi:prolyl-tRNA synthetase